MAVLQWLVIVGLVQTVRGQDVCVANGCTADDIPLLPATLTGATDHYYIGGMFGMHNRGEDPYDCGSIRLRGLLNAEAFFWAIRKYQVREGLTSATNPVSVGGFALDSCSRPERTIENLYSFDTCRQQLPNVSPRNTIAFVGPDTSTEALEVVNLLQEMQRTQVAHSATAPELSNNMYQYFLRTVPASSIEAEVMAKFLDQRYRYVQAIYEDTAYGKGIFHAFKMEAEARGICIVAMNAINKENLQETVSKVNENPKTRVVLLFAVHDTARKVLEAFNPIITNRR